jgi:hypothetical protein
MLVQSNIRKDFMKYVVFISKSSQLYYKVNYTTHQNEF